MEKFKYFILGLLSIVFVSFTTTNIQLFKPVKPVSVVSDCHKTVDLDEISLFFNNSLTKRNQNGYIMKDFQIIDKKYHGSSSYFVICIVYEKY